MVPRKDACLLRRARADCPCIVLAVALLLVTLAPAAELSLVDEGVRVNAGSLGAFTLGWPGLVAEQSDQPLSPIERRIEGRRAALKYAGGGHVAVSIEGQDTIAVDIRNRPAGVDKFRVDMLIDFSYADGGTWQIGGGDPTAFPVRKPPKPFLFQGNANTLRLTNSEGKALAFTVPPYSYEQLQDNREWNWKTFFWMFMSPLTSGQSRYTVTVSEAAGNGASGPQVDRFGQDARLDFEGKVRREAELREDAKREHAGGVRQRLKNLDPYGGMTATGAQAAFTKTGFFHVEQHGDRWWLVTPAGYPVFHLGICSFQPGEDYTYTKGRTQIYEWLPAYEGPFKTAFHPEPYWSRDTFSFYIANVIRKYGKPYDREEWTARMIPRVRGWGFNAGGAFSGITAAHHQACFPHVLSLPLSEWQLGRPLPGVRGLFDPFDAHTAAKLDELFSLELPGRADDPLVIGYFLANEQAFEDLPRVLPTLSAAQPAKTRLVAWLRERYPTLDAFNNAWNLRVARFDELADTGLAVTTQAASDDMQAFTGIFLNAYFRLVTETFHKYDANHLLLGNRWQPATANNQQLCQTAGRYVDVISVNYYTYAVDAEFLKRLYVWSGKKPMMLSEFYWASPSDTGLPGGKEVVGQRARGLAYRTYVEQAAALGIVVGIEWFTLIDQARSGRFFERYNGEKANSGLFSVTDRPYREFLNEAVKTNDGIYDVLLGRRPPFDSGDPLFTPGAAAEKTVKIPRAERPIRIDGQQSEWPGVPPERVGTSRLVEGADAAGLEAAFRLCWDDDWLYLLVDVTDTTPMRNAHKGDEIWNGDGIELFLGHERLEQAGALLFSDRQVLLSAGLPDGVSAWHDARAPRQYACELAVVPRVDGQGYTLEAAMPFEGLGFEPADGRVLRFDLGIDDSPDGAARVRQLMWNGAARNSGDRTQWGRAVLSK